MNLKKATEYVASMEIKSAVYKGYYIKFIQFLNSCVSQDSGVGIKLKKRDIDILFVVEESEIDFVQDGLVIHMPPKFGCGNLKE